MNHYRRKHYNRLGNTEFLQRIILYFLIGFFCGAVFYFCFQNSFGGLQKQFEQNMSRWSAGDSSFFNLFGKVLWNHGKYFALLWILSVSRISSAYQKLFVIYTGIRNGFLMLFFLYAKNLYGLVIYLASLFPHILLLAPLYLFSFFVIQGKKQLRHKAGFIILLLLVFGAACILEVRCNLPLMEALL